MAPGSAAGPLMIAEQGVFWVGVERVQRRYGLAAAGQMFVQYQIPAERRHPWPLVMVHGGGGQGTDYLGTPDGRPGWANSFLRRGWAVYVVDRPGLGRAPYHADLLGPCTPPPTYEALFARFAAPELFPNSYPQARLHTQWPGPPVMEDPVFDQFMAATGPSVADLAQTQADMQRCGVALLERIGPAALLTHSMGAAFGWLVVDRRPDLVKAILAVEPHGPPFVETPTGTLHWGLTAVPMTYDPPVTEPAELQRELRPAPAPNLASCFVQAEPARRLHNLAGVTIAVVTAEASWKAQEDHGVVDYLRQAGVAAEHLRLEEHGLHGNGHMMMIERNSEAVAALVAEWLERRVNG